MAGTPTTNYRLPTYADTDAPDLTWAYNNAMGKIDRQMKTNETAAAGAKSTADTAKTTADSALSKATANEGDIAELQEQVAQLSAGSFAPSSGDKVLTVAQLAAAKVTSAGIVYFKEG